MCGVHNGCVDRICTNPCCKFLGKAPNRTVGPKDGCAKSGSSVLRSSTAIRRHSIDTMESAFAKLSRAREHFAALQRDAEDFRARDTHRFSEEMAPWALDGTVGVVTRRVHIKESPPQAWSLVLGDVLTNLRAALDHAIYGHAAARQLLTPEDQRRISYPIFLDQKKWPRTRQALERLINPAVMNFIESTQPFNHVSGNSAEGSMLNPGLSGLADLNH
jgi:hypothetical protein